MLQNHSTLLARFSLLAVSATVFLASSLGLHSQSTWEPTSVEDALDIIDQRADWKSWPEMEFPRHPAEKLLKDWTIVLDPGHGGDAHRGNYKRGPSGVREAEINWRVGLLLERLLTDAGAQVTLTRSGDHDLTLAERAEVGNTVIRPDGGTGADLFISLHHNATSSPETNYTTVWFHGHADWSEPDLDAARYIAHGLFRNLRTDAALTSYLMSDQQMFPRGFGVLNYTKVPAILLETSFHTNPREEQRLRDALYNLREAYAIYTGLCEYAYGGRPTQSKPEITIKGEKVQLHTAIDDGMPKGWWGGKRNRTITSTVQLFLDDEPVPSTYDPEAKTLTATLPLDLAKSTDRENDYELRIHHANFAKHHNWPQRYRLALVENGKVFKPELTELGARRARRDTDPEELAKSSRPKSDVFAKKTPPPEPSAELAMEEKPVLPEATRKAIQSAKPGDIVLLKELPTKQVPVLNARLSALPGPQLIFSDMPEYFRTGDGVAMEEKVDAGPIRLYVYHVPEPTGKPKVITALIENLGDKPMTLSFQRDAFSKPSWNYHMIGKVGLADFFKGNSTLGTRTIAPGEIAAIDPRMDATTVTTDQLVHGFYEFEIDQPARILTLQRDPNVTNSEAAKTLPRLPRILPDTKASGAGRGNFPIADFLVTLSEDRLDTAEGPRQLVVADGRRDPWVLGTDSIAGEVIPNKGNYGVVYRIRIRRESSDGRSLAVFMHNSYAETQPCQNQASAIKISSGMHPGGIVSIPEKTTFFSGIGENVLLQTFAPLPEGESEIIEILYSPPGASCLPTPIFFVPF